MSQIYQEWFAAGQWCDKSHGSIVEVCDEVTTTTTTTTTTTVADESCTHGNFKDFAISVTERVNEIVNPAGQNEKAAFRLTKVIKRASK